MSGRFSEQKERMLRGEIYLARDPELGADSRRCIGLLARFNDLHADDARVIRALT